MIIQPAGLNFRNLNSKPNFGNETKSSSSSNENFIKNSIVEPLKKGGKATHTVASLLIPGLGQFLQDRNETGLNHLVVKGALLLVSTITILLKSKVVAAIGTLAQLGVNIYSAVDANRGYKSPKED